MKLDQERLQKLYPAMEEAFVQRMNQLLHTLPAKKEEEKVKRLTLQTVIVWALLAVVAVNVVNRKKEFFLTVPIVAVILTLLIATPVFAEFRYAYAVFTTLPFVGVVSLIRCSGKTNVE